MVEDNLNLPPNMYDAIKDGKVEFERIKQAETFKELTKDKQDEVIERDNEKRKEFGLVTKRASEIRNLNLIVIILTIAVIVGIFGYLYLGYNNYFKSDIALTQNVTNNVDVNIPPTTNNYEINVNVTNIMPDSLQINMENSS